MKKLTVLFFAIIFITSFTSCTREFICQCRVSYTGNIPGLPDSTLTETVLKNTKKEADANCMKNSVTTLQEGVTMTEKCTLY